jgi:tetratricopeptide (TPR) repeat protein
MALAAMVALSTTSLLAQTASTSAVLGRSLLIVPFENQSSAPGIEWISEAFPEVLGQRLATPEINLLPRQERLRAFDHAGIPAGVRPSRASIYRLAEQLDTDLVLFGQYSFDGETFRATAQFLDVRRARLLPLQSGSGRLPQLIQIQTALAWDLLKGLGTAGLTSREEFLAAAAPIRLDALENYTRGVLATTPAERIRHLRDALRINPGYSEAAVALGQAHFDEHQYDAAIAAWERVPASHTDAGRAQFLAGLSYYYLGQFERAENAFNDLASRLPLPEVYNNLGVMQARRGRKAAVESFQRATQTDPQNPDYHFNLAIALARNGDAAAAARDLRELLAAHSDSEARTLLEMLEKSKSAPNISAKLPLEHIQRRYDEIAFRQLAWQIQALAEQRLAGSDPSEHARFHLSRGTDLLARGLPAEAERDFLEAVTLTPANRDAHLGLARCLEARADFAGARREAEAAGVLSPSPETSLLLARLDLRDNRLEDAAARVEQALQLEPTNAAALALRHSIAAKLAQKAQPLPKP